MGRALVDSNRRPRSKSNHRTISEPRARNQMMSMVRGTEMSKSAGESPTARHNVAAAAT